MIETAMNHIIISLIALLTVFVNMVACTCECGLEGATNRIFNGRETAPNRYPWLAHIRFTTPGSDLFIQCGGSLIDNQHILTAAHCIHDSDGNPRNPKYTEVYLGIHHKIKDVKTPLRVADHIYDIRYDYGEPMDYDIAILRLKKPVKFSETISPICIPSSNQNSFKILTVAGWGNLDGTQGGAKTLREVDVDFISRETCNQMKYKLVVKKNKLPPNIRISVPPIHVNHICALNTKKGGDACAGDSGGPLMYKNNDGRWYVIGVVSGAWDVCGVDRGVPGLYTSVAAYRGTIKKVARGVCIRKY